jgi:hypothetical protein
MTGKTSGADLVNGLEGSDQAKTWFRAIVETLSGETTVVDAAAALHCNQAYFYRVRGRSLQTMLADLEHKRSGRKPREPDPQAERIRQLEDELRHTKGALEAASARVTVALGVPRSTHRPKGRSRAHPSS